jgi:3-deoxy-7-phosphoheptulonate synthase
LDLNSVPVLKELSHLPVVVDPSHGVGVARFVPALAKAALIAGADGVMVEMHPDPREALSDGSQALDPEQFAGLMEDFRKLAEFTGLAMG